MKGMMLLVIVFALAVLLSVGKAAARSEAKVNPESKSCELLRSVQLEDVTFVESYYSPARYDSAGLDSFIRATMDSAHIPATATWCSKNGQVIWQQSYGYANLEDSIAATDTTSFRLASISKTITGTAIMQLWERGLFELDDDVNDYLPFNVRNPNHPDSAITFRMLMTHTSSIRDYNLGQYWVIGDSPIPLGEFVAGYLVPGGTYYAPGNYTGNIPGTTYDYCGVTIGLLAYLVEAMEDSFPTHCQDSIFDPLSMNHTSWFLSGLDTNNIAVPYNWNGVYYASWPHSGYPHYPAGQLRASLVDLAQHLTAMTQNGITDTVRILDSATVDLMLSPHFTVTTNFIMGLTWRYEYVAPRWMWYHSGGSDGVTTVYAFCPAESSAIIVLTNGECWSTGVVPIALALFDYAQQYVFVEEDEVVSVKRNNSGATIFRGPLQLPQGKNCRVYDITGRVVEPNRIQPGIYFIEVDGVVTQKVVKVR